MAKKATSARKAERPSYENKAVAPAKRVPHNARIRVVRAHDGLEEGETYLKPIRTANEMVRLGFWEIIELV